MTAAAAQGTPTIRGVVPILITPFDAADRIDEELGAVSFLIALATAYLRAAQITTGDGVRQP